MQPETGNSGAKIGYTRRGGRPPLNVDLNEVCVAVQGAWNGSGESITAIAERFGVSRGWIHKHIYPALGTRGDGAQDHGSDSQELTEPSSE